MDGDDNAKKHIQEFEKARSMRFNFENQWQDIRELVRPNTADFNRNTTQGDRRTENIFDGTAPWALEQFAAGLDSFLTSPTERWFNISLAGDKGEDLSDEALAWLEHVSDVIFKEYAKPQVNLNPCLHEVYQDLGAFGTSVLYQDWDYDNRCVHFRSFPLADCYIKENSKGLVDTMYRMTIMSARQIMDEFTRPEDTIPPKIIEVASKDADKTYKVIHCVRPRTELKQTGLGAKKKKFASCWVVHELKATLRERGYDDFPYHVPRWTKLAGEQYGRSPAMTCLPDIKMINTMSRVIIVGAQKMIDPPLIVPDDGFMLPIKTSPGSLIFKAAGQEDTIQPLNTNGRPDIGLDMMTQRRDHITKSFYVDWIIRQKKNERQTTTEIVDDRNEMLRQMSPMLGRTEVELLSPLIIRTYNLKMAAGHIPPAPDSLLQKKLEITYVSPAALAQYGSKAQGIQQFMQDLAVLSPIAPEVMDVFDIDVAGQELAKLRNVTRKVIRSPDAIAQRRNDRAQQAQAQQMVAAGRELAATTKDLSVAKKNGGI
ncbi:Head-to-tail connector protein, podovirus-type [uncultured Caudovirales phage]|uniref:Head-to-tail connector protein, podovirus-type n=1 Tax=uncultured Caudovirales phage TaxID=2100421 RepID=A0A6J5QQ54_9CAUD|nr:Head-to-tail connector protein, podovirus-type [uncultured Caudovirales phage]